MPLSLVGTEFRRTQETKRFHRRNDRTVQDGGPRLESSRRHAADDQRWDLAPRTGSLLWHPRLRWEMYLVRNGPDDYKFCSECPTMFCRTRRSAIWLSVSSGIAQERNSRLSSSAASCALGSEEWPTVRQLALLITTSAFELSR